EQARAAGLLREAVAGFASIEDWWGAGQSRAGLAVLALMEGDYPEARRLFEEYLASARASDDHRSVGQALDGIAMVALWSGDRATAAILLVESVPICLAAGHLEYVAYGLGGLACVVARRQPIVAARLFGTLRRVLADVGVDEWPVRRDLFEAAQEIAQGRLGTAAYAA